MSYASYASIQPLDTYEAALTFVSRTRPVRGANRIPLGERRYHTTFDIVKRGEDVQCRLWDRPLVVYKPDGKIAITTGVSTDGVTVRRSNVNEAYFIANVLYNYLERPGADMVRGKVRLKLRNDINLILEPGKTLELMPDVEGKLWVIGDGRLEGWRLKRSATNNVRKRYGEFYRYLKGICSLRAESVRVGYNTYDDIVMITQEEMTEVPIIKQNVVDQRFLLKKTFLLDKQAMGPSIEWVWDDKAKKRKDQMVDRYAQWLEHVQSFLTFVSDTSENKHDSYYKAFLMVAYNASFHNFESTYMCQRKDIPNTLDEILFKYHSDEVFERVKLKVGQAPNLAYESWVNRVRVTPQRTT